MFVGAAGLVFLVLGEPGGTNSRAAMQMRGGRVFPLWRLKFLLVCSWRSRQVLFLLLSLVQYKQITHGAAGPAKDRVQCKQTPAGNRSVTARKVSYQITVTQSRVTESS